MDATRSNLVSLTVPAVLGSSDSPVRTVRHQDDRPCTDGPIEPQDFARLIRDDSTEAYNKFYLLEVLQRELHLAQRSTAPLAIMHLEMDNFHAFDRPGLKLGGRVLREVVRTVQGMVRRGDLLARYSEQSLVLLCAYTRLPDAMNLGERIRQAVAARTVLVGSSPLSISLSIGVTEFAASRSDEPNAFDADSLATVLLAEAQQYATNAVRRGGNQVIGCG